ncbi:hypothetical protein HY251_11365, partial [bacterium]|nr:hypothetical protein [bacterium]
FRRPRPQRRASALRTAATFLVAAVSTFAALSRLSAEDGTGEVKGTVSMNEQVRKRAGTLLVLLESKDPAKKLDAKPRSHVVKQRDAKFVPSFLAIAKDDTVVFQNDEVEDLEHNVYSFADAKKFDLGLFGKKTDKNSVVFDKAGEVPVYCSVHKFMEATIYVAPTPFYALADPATGAFTIASVPAGEWKARTWSSSKRYANEEAAVTVKAGSSADLSLTFGRRQ